MTKKKSFLDIVSTNKFIHTLLSIILGFLVAAIFLVIMGIDVGTAYGRLLSSVTGVKLREAISITCFATEGEPV